MNPHADAFLNKYKIRLKQFAYKKYHHSIDVKVFDRIFNNVLIIIDDDWGGAPILNRYLWACRILRRIYKKYLIDREFTAFFKENNKRLWRSAFYLYHGFYRLNSGAWEEAYQEAWTIIYECWDKHHVSNRCAWVYKIIMRTMLRHSRRCLRDSLAVISLDEYMLGIDDDEGEEGNLIENFPDNNIDANECINLIKSINKFVEECAKKYVKGKRSPFTTSVENIINLFLCRDIFCMTGPEFKEFTIPIKSPGMAENQQTQALQEMRKCVANRACMAGFENLSEYVKNLKLGVLI